MLSKITKFFLFNLTFLSFFLFFPSQITYADVPVTEMVPYHTDATRWQVSFDYYRQGAISLTHLYGPFTPYMDNFNSGEYWTSQTVQNTPVSGDIIKWKTACVDPNQDVSLSQILLPDGITYETKWDVGCHYGLTNTMYQGCYNLSSSTNYGSITADSQCPVPSITCPATQTHYCVSGGGTAGVACTVGCTGTTYKTCSGTSCVSSVNDSRCACNNSYTCNSSGQCVQQSGGTLSAGCGSGCCTQAACTDSTHGYDCTNSQKGSTFDCGVNGPSYTCDVRPAGGTKAGCYSTNPPPPATCVANQERRCVGGCSYQVCNSAGTGWNATAACPANSGCIFVGGVAQYSCQTSAASQCPSSPPPPGASCNNCVGGTCQPYTEPPGQTTCTRDCSACLTC